MINISLEGTEFDSLKYLLPYLTCRAAVYFSFLQNLLE